MSESSVTDRDRTFSQQAWVTYTGGWMDALVVLSIGALTALVGFGVGLSGVHVSTAPLDITIERIFWIGQAITLIGMMVVTKGVQQSARMWLTRRDIKAATGVSD